MGAWLQVELGNDIWSRTLVVLIDAGVKGMVLLALAGLVTLAMRRASASARHLVWTLALVGLLLIPAVSLVMPKWQLPILPMADVAQEKQISAPVDKSVRAEAVKMNFMDSMDPMDSMDLMGAERPKVSVAPVEASDHIDFEAAPILASQPKTTPAPENPSPMAYWASVTWLAIAFGTLMPLLAGLVTVYRLRLRASLFPVKAVQELAHSLGESLGLKRNVTLLGAKRGTMPMAAGLMRHAIFLPLDAADWPNEKLRSVLLHELAHVKRRDCLTHALARLAVAIHWFNPLVWVALRRLRIERERACDDLVLTAGERPSTYADHLLDIARTMHADTLASAAAITMAKKGQLEGRLRAVLDAARNRRAIKWWAIALGAMMLLTVTVPLGMTELSAKTNEPEETMKTNVVIWQAIGDDTIVKILGLEPNSLQSKTDYIHPDPIDGDQLLEDLRTARANGSELIPARKMLWLKEKSRSFSGPNHLTSMVHSDIQNMPGEIQRMEMMMLNGFASLELDGAQAVIVLDQRHAHANISLNKMHGGKSVRGETRATSQDIEHTKKIDPGQAAFSIAPLVGNTAKDYYHFSVIQAVSVPENIREHMHSIVETERWLNEGPQAALQEISGALAWAQAGGADPKRSSTNQTAIVRQVSPDKPTAQNTEDIPRIDVIAIGRPKQWPHRWWDMEGRPVKANPAWQRGINVVEDRNVGVVYDLEHDGGVLMELRFPDQTDPPGSNTLLNTGERMNFSVKVGQEPWSEIGEIHEGEKIEVDGGTFHLEDVHVMSKRRNRWFKEDDPAVNVTTVKGEYDPDWEIAIVAEDKAGNRVEGQDSISGSVSQIRNRYWTTIFQMDKTEIAKFVILKRPTVEYVIENLPTEPIAPLDDVAKANDYPAESDHSSLTRRPHSGVLEGAVLGPDGKPLAGAPLSLHVFHPGGLKTNALRTISDEQGHWRMENVPAGRHLLFYPWAGPSKSEVTQGIWDKYKKPSEVYPSAPIKDICGAMVIKKDEDVAEGETITDIVMDLSKSTAAAEGQVTDADGRPVEGAEVDLWWKSERGQVFMRSKDFSVAVTDAQGHYRLENLPPGSWAVHAWHPQSNLSSPVVPAELEMARTTNQNLRMEEVTSSTEFNGEFERNPKEEVNTSSTKQDLGDVEQVDELTKECLVQAGNSSKLDNVFVLGHEHGVEEVALLAELPALRRLDMYDLSDEELAALPDMPLLEELVFQGKGYEYTAAGFTNLSRYSQLKSLAVFGRFQDEAFVALEPMLSLKELQLHKLWQDSDYITDVSLEHISKFSSLESLRIFTGRFTDNGLKHLAKLPNLKSLDITNNRGFTNASLQTLKDMKSLKKYKARGENITDEGLQYLVEARSLKRFELFVTNEQITDDGIARLQKQRPDLVLYVRNKQLRPDDLRPRRAVEKIHPSPTLQFRWVAEEEKQDQAELFLWHDDNVPGQDSSELWLLKDVLVNENDLASVFVHAVSQGSDYRIFLEFKDDAKQRFAGITEQGVGQKLAVVVNGGVVSVQTVRSKITEGRVSITGNFTKEQAESLVLAISTM